MDIEDYARFLPVGYRAAATAPRSTWWNWRGRNIHVLRSASADAPVRLLGVHGAGGRAAALWPVASAIAGDSRFVEVVFPDLPLYGDTIEPAPAQVRYETWVEMVGDLVADEAADGRPLVLFGASTGGVLAYEVAARTRLSSALAVTCLLDPRDPAALRCATRFGALGEHARALLPPLSRVAGSPRVPMPWVEDLDKMSRDPRLSRICRRDRKGGAARVPIGFLASFVAYEHARPEDFDAVPLTPVHPA